MIDSASPARTRWADVVLALLRVIAALLYMQHGAQKFFGVLGDPSRPWNGPPELLSQRGLAGVLELVGGALLALGLFSRPVAFLLAGEMAVAYFQFHAPRGFWPVMNGGENVILFCFVFLYLCVHGPGPYSADGMLARRRGVA